MNKVTFKHGFVFVGKVAVGEISSCRADGGSTYVTIWTDKSIAEAAEYAKQCAANAASIDVKNPYPVGFPGCNREGTAFRWKYRKHSLRAKAFAKWALQTRTPAEIIAKTEAERKQWPRPAKSWPEAEGYVCPVRAALRAQMEVA